MPRILITGGNGFIAKKLAFEISHDSAFDLYNEIVIYSRRSLDYIEELRAANPRKNFQSVIFDLCNELIENKSSLCFDLVFHLAASASFPGNKESYNNNIIGTEKLLNSLLADSSKTLKSIIFCSSMGAVDRARNDQCIQPMNDKSGMFPQSLYGKSKLKCEQLIKASGLPYTIIRPSMVYGPGMRNNSHIRVLISKVLKRSLISKIYFPGRISIIHINDLCRLLTLIAKDNSADSKTIFAAHELTLAIGEISRIASKYCLRSSSMYKFPKPIISFLKKMLLYAPFKVKSLFFDALTVETTTAESLGFQCKVTHEEGILETLNWHSRQEFCKEGEKEWAIITGAANGIGKELTLQLYSRGYKILMIDKEKINWPKYLEAKNSAMLSVNLCDTKESDNMLSVISSAYSPIAILINCAGIGRKGQFEQISSNESEQIIDLNIKALHKLSCFAIQEFKKTGKKGTLLNIASSAAFQPLPYMATYAASKSFVLNFTAAIKEELREFSEIKIYCVCPGGVETGFQKTAGVKSNKWEKLQTAQETANYIAEAILKKNEFLIIRGVRAKIMYLLGRLLGPKLSSGLWRRLMNSLR